ncbi:MAG TPA: AAA family ATPase [Polyangiaceae bacterium]|nr:AAA family ATPase [Polyangiaceae bacterium]
MERFYVERPERFGDYQTAPGARVEHVLVERTIHDAERKQRWEVRARLGVLVERWPEHGFLVVTPTRLPALRFAVLNDDVLDEAVAARVAAWCLDERVRSLEPWHCRRRERLELLHVDAIAPTILPHTHPRALKALRPPSKAAEDPANDDDDDDEADGEPAEPPTPAERDERRRIARLAARVLRQVGRNLSHAVEDDNLDRAFGRDGLVDRLVDELGTREGAALVLVGPPGVGKSAVAHEFARRLYAFNARHGLRRDVWRVDGNRFIAGMKYVGQWEARAREMLAELAETGDILYLDDLASMVQAGRTAKGDTNVAQFLAPAVAKGSLTVLAESTPERLAWAREEAPGFVQLFRTVALDPLSSRASLPVLLGALRGLEGEVERQRTPQRMTPSALEATLRLAERFLPNEAFPGKAVRLLRATLDRPVEPTPARGGGLERRYGPAEVQAALQQRTGLPEFVLDPSRALTRPQIVDRFLALIAGQPEAVDALADLVVALQQGLTDPDKPLGTFLFVGPTGVGKTESARALARVLFGGPERMARFDMSEFAEPYAVARLIGRPGDPDGELTAHLRAQPFSVVLFDEIEKAHPRVFDALLQLLGEGRISDAAGRLSDARQAVIIMTSNLGVREAASHAGFLRASLDEARAHYLTAARRFFRPEFFNRIDRLVPFRPLDPEALRRVVEQQLGELLGRRGIARANLLVEVEPATLDALVERAYDPRFGARPLKREMERQLTVPLAHHLVRRRHDDLTLVMLQWLGGRMALGVRALHERPSPPPPPPAPSTPREAQQAFRALGETLDALYAELGPRLEARSGDETLDRARAHLLDELRDLRDNAQRAEEDPILNDEFVEQEVTTEQEQADHWVNDRRERGNRNRYRGGLRPKPGFMLLPALTPPGAIVHRARTLLLPLLDDALVLGAQGRAAHAIERYTLLLEALPGALDLEALAALCRALADQVGGRAERELEAEGAPRWEPLLAPAAAPAGEAPRPPSRRVRVVVQGFALGPLASALAGFAISGSGYLGMRMVARVHALEGADPDARVRAFDAERERVRARRHAGEDLPVPDVPDRVTLRELSPGRWTHVPTGVTIGAHAIPRTLLAAVLRAPAGEAAGGAATSGEAAGGAAAGPGGEASKEGGA